MNKKFTGPATGLPLALSVAAALVASPSRVPDSGSAVATKNAPLLSAPLANGTVVGRLARGDTVAIVAQNWRYVRARNGAAGWVSSQTLSNADLGTGTVAQSGTEVVTNAACPPVGTHKVGGKQEPYAANVDAGLRNMAKRHISAAGTPTTLTLADFSALQVDINNTFGDATRTKTKFEPNRDGLHDLSTSSGRISEGDPVQLAGFVAMARNQGAESVNCSGSDGTDIHISIGNEGGDEYGGIVAEMIPQLPRPVGWDAPTLNQIHNARLPVLVVGSLTYDNEHLVNGDPKHPKQGQPKRMSLWEIHPITEFYVCVNPNGCDPSDHGAWILLADWASAHGP